MLVGMLACGGTNEPAAEGSTGEGSSGSSGPIGASEGTSSDVASGEDSGTTVAAESGGSSTGETPLQPAELLLMDTVIFYDGYAETVDEPTPEGVVRLSNAVNTVRLTDAQLDVIQPRLRLDVLIGALCDNYDRIGSVNLALTDKGAQTYDPAEVTRLEVARFITPFMNKNREPDTVPYTWEIDAVAEILRDPTIRERYDVWFELDVFGVPYAANTEVSGCEGRNDVFRGWLGLTTDSTVEAQGYDTLIPLAMKQPFNDYQEGASDAVGTTRKTIAFEIEDALEEAKLVLITSNHGANAGGEEYSRRDHFVYLDEALVLEYRPGRASCEPFREFNTQANGIYGPTPRTDEEWQSFSNWCPGDVIDTRIVELGALEAGAHSFVIDVPEAVFTGDQGDFPLSLRLQGR